MTSRTATETDRNIAHARLTGLAAWNGQGLKAYLAETSPADSDRLWMEPLMDLLVSVRDSFDAGAPVELSESDSETIDELIQYQADFSAALE